MTDVTQVNATPHALRLSARWGVDLKKVRGSGRGERISVSDLESAIVAAGGRPGLSDAPVRRSKAPRSHADDSRYRPPRWRAVWPANWVSTCMTAEAVVHVVG